MSAAIRATDSALWSSHQPSLLSHIQAQKQKAAIDRPRSMCTYIHNGWYRLLRHCSTLRPGPRHSRRLCALPLQPPSTSSSSYRIINRNYMASCPKVKPDLIQCPKVPSFPHNNYRVSSHSTHGSHRLQNIPRYARRARCFAAFWTKAYGTSVR